MYQLDLSSAQKNIGGTAPPPDLPVFTVFCWIATL